MPRLNADRCEPGVDERTVKPFRQRAGFDVDELDVLPSPRECLIRDEEDADLIEGVYGLNRYIFRTAGTDARLRARSAI